MSCNNVTVVSLPVPSGGGDGVGVGVGGCGRAPSWHSAEQGMMSARLAVQL